jgi:hypothetical protein
MSNLLQKAGAQPSHPIKYGVLWSNRFATGIWTQRSPLRDAASTRIEEEFYGARGDALIDGLNCEVSTRLTYIRRPGLSVYNSQTFPAINRFYENRTSTYNTSQTASTEIIQTVADTASVVYDATGPNTKTAIFNKTAGAGATSFQSVGNTLYFSDGPDQEKLLTPTLVWAPNTVFNQGDYIKDPNGNIQVAESAFTLNITNILISSISGVFYALVTFNRAVPWVDGTDLTFQGMTAYTGLNTQTLTTQSSTVYGANADQVAVLAATATTPFGPAGETGTASSQNTATQNQSGATQPTWNLVVGGTTNDGNVQWRNFGNGLYNWGVATPTVAPTISQNPDYRSWTPNTALNQYFTILDSNNNIQFVSVAGTTGSSTPTWNGQVPSVTFNTVSGTTVGTPNAGGPTSDNSVTWLNGGPLVSWSPSTVFGYNKVILDSNGNLQLLMSATSPYQSGTSAPTWNATVGGSTTDGSITWQNVGIGNIVFTGSVQYAFSYHAIDGSVSTASPTVSQNFNSQVFGPPSEYRAKLFGPTINDPQIDQIWIWRTTQGGGLFLFLDAVPNPAVGTATTWQYTDFLPDTSLDDEIEAPLSDQNDPPPVGLTALTFHLGCVFGAVENEVFYSNGPSDTVGNGSTAWSPSNVFVFPSTVVRLAPTSNGLLVFTTSDVYIILGTNTAGSELFDAPFLKDIGLFSYDAFSVNGGIMYLYTSDNQVITLDPSSGVSEIGFPIGDQFGPTLGIQTFTPSTAHVTWHIAGSLEHALYVSDFQGSWWRMLANTTPETGHAWCPIAEIVGGFSAVESIETSPGTHQLLVGPKTSGPILKRDYAVSTDNGSAYDAFAVLGSVVLAQPGQIAIVESITTDSIAVGTPISLQVQLDEISFITGLASVIPDNGGVGYAVGNIAQVNYAGAQVGTVRVASVNAGIVTGLSILQPGEDYPEAATGLTTTNITGSGAGLTVNITNGGFFEKLSLYAQDPTQLEPSVTTYAQRFYLSQTQMPAVCRHMQIAIEWGTEDFPNELLSLTVFGGFESEK